MVDIPIAEAIVHENYIASFTSPENDIALIRLQRSAPHTDYIHPICLPAEKKLQNKNYDKYPMIVAGFGRDEDGTARFGGVLGALS